MAPADRRDTAIVNASGVATVTIRTQGRQVWTISQVSVEMPTAPSGSTCTLRKNGAFVSLLVAQGDAAGGDPPLTLRPSDTMTITWTGCTAGDLGAVYTVYEDGT